MLTSNTTTKQAMSCRGKYEKSCANYKNEIRYCKFCKTLQFSFLMITALLSTQPHSLFLDIFHCHCFTDRDECTEIPGICANGRCENTEGSFACICQEGYKLNNERSFCISEEFISFFAKYLHLLDLVVPFYS